MIKDEEYILLANLVTESKGNVEERLKGKFQQLRNQPEKIFDDGEYYYDTEVREHEFWRGEMEVSDPEVKAFILVDTLQIGNYLCEQDWKDDSEETNYSLSQLAKAKDYHLPELKIIDSKHIQSLDGYLKDKNKEINNEDLILIGLNIDGCYISGLIKESNFQAIYSQASKCNLEVIKY